MPRPILAKRLGGVWSATPTPLNDKMQIDRVAVRRLVEHHIKLGVNGLFLCGTCGEGPWMPDRLRWAMVRNTARYNDGRLVISVQVTDNSEARILDNIAAAQAAGANIAVLAPPYLPPHNGPERLVQLYVRTIRQSPLPVGIYDRGRNWPTHLPDSLMQQIYAQKNVVMIKDSSADPARRRLALAARRKRKNLRLMNGWEFNNIPYLLDGYDGLLLGGGIFNGYIAGQIIAAVRNGDLKRARALQRRMNRIMWDAYGGKDLSCWLSGLKMLLVKMGIFRTHKSFLEYPLTAECRKAIKRILTEDADILFPWRHRPGSTK